MPKNETFTFSKVKSRVWKIVPKKIFQELLEFVKMGNPLLWGMTRPRAFLEKSLYVTLFKIITGKGNNKLAEKIRAWYKISHKSIAHNAKILFGILGKWGKSKIVLGTSSDWNRVVRNSNFMKAVSDTNLWMDSTDFPMEGKRTISKKSEDWSFKCNSPGRRFMVLSDGNGIVKKMWGGYSPKIYDGTWVELFKDWLEENLKGGVVVADNHFMWAKNNLKQVKFHCNYPEKKKEEIIDSDDDENATVLTEQKKAYNSAVRNTRARVEDSFGILKNYFNSLKFPWRESSKDLDNLVFFGIGLLNELRK